MRWYSRKFAAAVTAGLLGGAALTVAAPAQAFAADWQLSNQTSVPLWGDWHGQCGGPNTVSMSSFDAAHALKPLAYYTLGQECETLKNLYQWGRMCYQGKWWNLTHDGGPYHTTRFYFREKTEGSKKILVAQTSDGNLLDMVETSACS